MIQPFIPPPISIKQDQHFFQYLQQHKSLTYWNEARGDSIQVTREESSPFYESRVLIVSDKVTVSIFLVMLCKHRM